MSMKRRVAGMLTACCAALIAVPPARGAEANMPGATGQTPPAEVTLAFARRNIWNWEADGQKGIWVEDIGHRWYYGKFMAPCIDLPFREGVAFRFGPAGELDKFGGLEMRGFGPCNFISFTRSDGPPHPKKKSKPAAAAPTASPAPAVPSG